MKLDCCARMPWPLVRVLYQLGSTTRTAFADCLACTARSFMMAASHSKMVVAALSFSICVPLVPSSAPAPGAVLKRTRSLPVTCKFRPVCSS